jgi:hypothetical protein|tara:strand:+ start:9620 stop:9961 length:342 start_codon:yes stop_codon:yes gene_type:complete
VRKLKYGNRKTEVDGILFDSKKEAAYYCELKLRKKAGDIFNFDLQPVYELQTAFRDNSGKHIRAITYKADFVVYEDGKTTIVDVKGMKTEVFKIKWKMLKYKYRERGYEFLLV